MTGDLAARFADPPATFGPVPIWWWSGAPLDPARLRWQMQQLLAGGVRQAVVLNLAPSGPLYGAVADSPEFFSEAWWEIFQGVCRDAEELGFGLWFYDQLGFSGADVQGRVLRQEVSFRGQALERVVVTTEGPTVLTAPDGSEPLAGFVVPVDDDGRLTGPAEHLALDDGRLVWEGTGRYRLSLAVAVPRGFDYLSVPACAALRDAVHGEFDRRVGHLFGTVIVGSFQDELASMPSWSADFAAEFTKRRGYPLEDLLVHLWEDLGEQSAAVRADYQRTRADLAEEAFFRPLHDWHEQRGLLAGCDQQHPARAGYPLEATQQYADYLRTHRWFSAPGSDHWGDAKVHSSLAHLYDRPRTWVEAFHSTGWGGTVEETLDWLLPWLRAGANLYNPHAVYYATPAGDWEWAPPSTCWRQPYWRHHEVFARTVARLCAALTWGDHDCDIAVLFPTTTAQAELQIDRPEALMGSARGTSAAQDLYLDIVGTMHWYEPQPGVLDRAGWDLDVIDDDSLTRGIVREGRLAVGRESYGAVVLPGCHVVAGETLQALVELAEGGGTVVVVGDAPDTVVGPGNLDRFRALLEQGVVRRVAHADDLPAALDHLPRRVVAPGPTLLRSDGESGVLLVLAAHPGATVQPVGRRYREEGYDFDPGRYAPSTTVSVTGFAEPVALWDPVSGTSTALSVLREGDRLTVEVPFTTVPCALVVFGPLARTLPVGPAIPAGTGERIDLDAWTATLLPTLLASTDDAWGDTGLPADPGPVQVWHLEHDVAGTWVPVTVTYGPWAQAVGPAPTSDLPAAGSAPDASWWDVTWSQSRGRPGRGDPKGFVPEEFLDLGEVVAGEAVHLRIVVRGGRAERAYLVLGSGAAREAWWNGEPVSLDESVYYARAEVVLSGEDDVLELRLTARVDGPLRGSWELRPTPDVPRPEWLTGCPVLEREVEIADPTGAVLQLGTIGRVSLEVNGIEVARHGECDNYTHVAQPRVRRYDLEHYLRPGRNMLRIQLLEPQAAAVVDADLGDRVVVTDAAWLGDGEVRGLAHVPHDPRWVHMVDREHPLPHGIEILGAGGEQRFRFRLPPGASAVRLPVEGEAQVSVEGRQVTLEGDEYLLDEPVAAGTWCTVRVRPAGTAVGGALWTGPVVVTRCAEAAMPLGDWQHLGLQDYSGGVRYRTTATADADLLDLGTVRGTVEARIDGQSVGCRLWSPYVFDVRGLVSRGSVVEVDVYNTLGPHQAAVSTTPWVLPGQTVSGLFGPAALLRNRVSGES